MKCNVQLFVAGKLFYEEVEARDYKEAREVALARNPSAKVMAVTAVSCDAVLAIHSPIKASKGGGAALVRHV